MNVRLPLIAFNALTCLDPKYLGLAAWLGASSLYPSQRNAIMRHVAKTGAVDESLLHHFDGAEDLAAAAQAHEDWQHFLTAIGSAVPKPAITFNRIANGNGHHVTTIDPAGLNGQESPDDIEF